MEPLKVTLPLCLKPYGCVVSTARNQLYQGQIATMDESDEALPEGSTVRSSRLLCILIVLSLQILSRSGLLARALQPILSFSVSVSFKQEKEIDVEITFVAAALHVDMPWQMSGCVRRDPLKFCMFQKAQTPCRCRKVAGWIRPFFCSRLGGAKSCKRARTRNGMTLSGLAIFRGFFYFYFYFGLFHSNIFLCLEYLMVSVHNGTGLLLAVILEAAVIKE